GAPELGRPVRVIGGAEGKVDLRKVTMVHLALPYLSSNQTLIFGNPGIIRGEDVGDQSYQGIADEFGQYTHATWPEKVNSTADIQENGRREEPLLRKWLADLPPSDHFGGSLDGPRFKATGFFRTVHANGRWQLVTPEGHPFFSLGMDVVSPEVGETFI